MADVRVNEPHNNLATDDVKKRLDSFEEQMRKYGVKLNWKGAKANLKGTGVSGSIDITSSDVTIFIKLGMLAKAAGIDAKRLEGSIRKRLKAALEA